ncbi:MAG: hypothetical protein ACK4GO_05715 [Gemmobacter sp.]
MKLDWSEPSTTGAHLDDTTPVDLVDPYENWERLTRPGWQKGNGQDTDQELWQPVYVELLPRKGEHYQSLAKQLLDAENATSMVLDPDAAAMLMEIEGTANDQNVPEELLRFFVYRPESLAYSTKGAGTLDLPYKVIQVGPAIPFAFVEQADREFQWAPVARNRGSEVVTAVIDGVMGIANERFRLPDDKTRIQRFWAQGMPSRSEESGRFEVGIHYDKGGLDDLLRNFPVEADFYRAFYPKGMVGTLRTIPRGLTDIADQTFYRPFGFQATHGTHVLDLAAGWPCESAPPDRPIVAVQLPQLATFETWGARLDLFILSGVLRILRWADRWPRFPGAPPDEVVRAPVVINISYGTQAGPKDGRGFLEAEIARLVGLRNAAGIPTAVVLPSGNAYRTQCHAEMRLPRQGTNAVTLRVQPEDLSVSFVEIWLDELGKASLTITPPVGPARTIHLMPEAQVVDWRRSSTDTRGKEVPTTIGRIYVRHFPGSDKDGARTRVVIALCPTMNHDDPKKTAPPGPYGIALRNGGRKPLVARLDVQRDDSLSDFPMYGRQAYLDHEAVHCIDPETLMQNLPCPDRGPITRGGTLSAMATTTEANVIVVGSAFDRDWLAVAALESGAGPNGARSGPDLGAIGTESRAHPGRLAAGTFSGGTAIFDGTSAAAPLVTRALVDLWSKELPADGKVDIAELAGALSPADPRLGSGVLAYTPSPGRPERRLRESSPGGAGRSIFPDGCGGDYG